MKNTTNTIQDKINEAREIQSSTTSFMSGLMTEFYRPEVRAIELDSTLSDKGKKEKAEKLIAKYEVAFMREMQTRRDKYEALLQEVKLEAEKVLITAVSNVEDHTQKLFDLEMKKAQGAVMFASNSTIANEALKKLVDAAKEPALAQQALVSFMELSQQSLALTSGDGKLAVRRQLGKLYQRLEKQSEVEGTQEARHVLETAEAMAGMPFAIGYIQEAISEISTDASKYMNEPNRYFEEKAGFVSEVEAAR